MEFSEKEALRYLGFRGKPADADTLALLKEVGAAASACVQPKSIYKEVSLRRVTDEVSKSKIEIAKFNAIKVYRNLPRLLHNKRIKTNGRG